MLSARMKKLVKTLIEKQDRHNWRIVERAVTAKGLSPDKFKVIEAGIPEYKTAKAKFMTAHS